MVGSARNWSFNGLCLCKKHERSDKTLALKTSPAPKAESEWMPNAVRGRIPPTSTTKSVLGVHSRWTNEAMLVPLFQKMPPVLFQIVVPGVVFHLCSASTRWSCYDAAGMSIERRKSGRDEAGLQPAELHPRPGYTELSKFRKTELQNPQFDYR